MITAGQVAFLKTSDEPVFVLKVDEESHTLAHEFAQLSCVTALVRRPVADGDKVTHHLERYAIEELETREESYKRKIEIELSAKRLLKDYRKAFKETVEDEPEDAILREFPLPN